MYRSLFSFGLARSQKDLLHEFHIFFLTTNHIIAISNKVSMEYINISDIKELATIGIAGARGISWDNGTASAPPDSKGIPSLEINFLGQAVSEIIWDESFIGGSGISTS